MPARTEDPAAPLVVVNPRAARLHDPARRASVVDAVVAAVRSRTHAEPRVLDGTIAQTDAALASATHPPLVVAVGGDGTLRLVVAAMLGRSTTLAVVPGGTGNVLAGALGIGGLRPALDTIRHGAPRTLDVGEATFGVEDEDPAAASSERTAPAPGRTIFLVACGMGLDARIMAAAEHEWKRRMRFGAYVGAALRELGRLQVAAFTIEADGTAWEMPGYLALVANAGDLVPGRLGPRRRIDPEDGRLDLIVLGGRDPVAALRGAARLMLDRSEVYEGVVRRSVDRITIRASPLQPIETDGDPHPAGWLSARVLPGAIRLLHRPTR